MSKTALQSSELSSSHQPTLAAKVWLEKLATELSSDTPTNAADLFEETAFWRDLIAFTWNIKTLEVAMLFAK